MDIKAYIESGAIEAYVLGLATEAEAAELLRLRREYAEVDAAVIDFEKHLEQTMLQQAEEAPSFVKEHLNNRLAADFRQSADNGAAIVAMRPSRPIWKYMAAAAIILFVASGALNLYQYRQYQLADEEYKKLLSEYSSQLARNDVMNTKVAEMNESLKIMTDPAVLAVSMPSTSTANHLATVYWDTRTKDVYLLSNNLPKAPSGKQYQLWALVDGQPVDAGMMGECAGLCHMKNIQRAQAFAITLEKQGGSPTPDLTQLYVLGKI